MILYASCLFRSSSSDGRSEIHCFERSSLEQKQDTIECIHSTIRKYMRMFLVQDGSEMLKYENWQRNKRNEQVFRLQFLVRCVFLRDSLILDTVTIIIRLWTFIVTDVFWSDLFKIILSSILRFVLKWKLSSGSFVQSEYEKRDIFRRCLRFWSEIDTCNYLLRI